MAIQTHDDGRSASVTVRPVLRSAGRSPGRFGLVGVFEPKTGRLSFNPHRSFSVSLAPHSIRLSFDVVSPGSGRRASTREQEEEADTP